MLKDRKQLAMSQTRQRSGRWSGALSVRLDWLEEAMTEQKPIAKVFVGLSKVNSEYDGLCKARRKLLETRYGDVQMPPNFAFEVRGEDGKKILTTQWQGWYINPVTREQFATTKFTIVVTSTKCLVENELFVVEEDGSLRPLKQQAEQPPIPGLDGSYAAHPGFVEQYTDEAEYELLRGKIIRLITRQEKEKMYALMRAEPERFEPFHARLAAEGLDYKETLADYEARQGHEEPPPPPMAQPAVVERVVGPPPKVQGAMTLQELRRLIDGYGEIPLAGEEDSDADWKRFEARFLELNGAEAKSPLRAALKIMQRERAALATSD